MLHTFTTAISSLKRNKVRTSLTVFGITIGIAVVIIVLSAGNGVKRLILNEVDSFGSNWINIEVKVPSADQISSENASSQSRGVVITTLTLGDKKAVAELDNIDAVYAGLTSQSVVSYTTESEQPLIFGVTSEYVDIDQGRIASGRFYTEDEAESAADVVVLGSGIKETLFGNDTAVGIKIDIGGKKYEVIGVFEERGATGFFNFDDVVFLPTQTVQRNIMGVDHVQFMVAELRDNSIAKVTAEEIRFLLRDRHDIDDPVDDDFAVTTQEESIALIDTIFFGITALLVVLAAISLVVGGVGIMNVMYVSVVERTFEIGLRKAVGAREADISRQFLVEAILLTMIGGAIGIVGGIFLSFVVAIVAQSQGLNWQFELSIPSIIIGTVFSLSVGLIFGYFPAKRAAALNPISALRDE
jgi:putative ABC transport system permease protein